MLLSLLLEFSKLYCKLAFEIISASSQSYLKPNQNETELSRQKSAQRTLAFKSLFEYGQVGTAKQSKYLELLHWNLAIML